MHDQEHFLVLDSCGESASLALFLNGALLEEISLPERTASGSLLAGVRHILQEAGLTLMDLAAIGVVNGPGSFTGIRIGLATAKGLCEAVNLPLSAVSRLAVLGSLAFPGTQFAVLRGGRDEVYVRDLRPGEKDTEFLSKGAAMRELLAEKRVIYAEQAISPLLAGAASEQKVELSARDAYPVLAHQLREGAARPAALDGNYVRDEKAIYAVPNQGS